MRDGILVTGGTGFVGRRLLPALQDLGRPVWALARTGSSGSSGSSSSVTWVRGDLLDPSSYREALGACSTVLHLAAATGKASAADHARVNARGTEVLLDACRQAGVTRVLFVSSIAATFPTNIGYHYADAKRQAEAAVSRAGIPFAVVRPTMILGPGAPILGSLEKLALLPLIVMPGNGRVRVQPIHVDDVAGQIVEIVRAGRFDNETLEIGGPDVATMEEVLQRLRVARTGRAGRVMHIPLGLMRLPLRAAEAIGLGGLLPITAGQLSSFQYDGVAAANGLHDAAVSRLIGLASMVSTANDAMSAAPPAAVAMVEDAASECRVFTRHLLGCEPDAYVQGKYAAALASMRALAPVTRFDRLLVTFARKSPSATRFADAYASLLLPGGALRKRLVLLLAILETRTPFHERIDDAAGGPVTIVIAKLIGRGVIATLGLVAGVIVFVPARAVLALMPEKPA